MVSRHISVTNLAGEVVHVILVKSVLVRICVIIAEGVAVFGLGGVLCSEPQAVAIDAVCQRKFEVDFELQVFFVDFLVAFGQFLHFPFAPFAVCFSVVQVDVRSHVRETVAGIYDGKAEEVLFQAEVSFVRTVFAGTGVGSSPVDGQLSELMFTAQTEVHCLL